MQSSNHPSNLCSQCGARNASYVVYCRSCGELVRPQRKDRIVRYHVSYWLDGSRFKLDQTFSDYSIALRSGIQWIDYGPVARTREARISRTINDDNDSTFSETLKYDNYRQRRSSRLVDGNCDTCKGKGRLMEKARNGYVDITCPVCFGMQKNYSKASSQAVRFSRSKAT